MDTFNEIREIVESDELAIVRDIREQVCGEWFNFEKDVGDEIKYLEPAVLESCSVRSKGSKLNKSIKSLNSKSSVDSEH